KDNQEPETLNAYAPAPSFIDNCGKKRRENREARISLYSTSLKIKKVKVKRGKISDSNLNDVEKLVIENKELIYEEEERHTHPKLLKLEINEQKITAYLEDKREISIPVSELAKG
ncbi:12355_t:CDS:2, partial [Racocetra fulgida]